MVKQIAKGFAIVLMMVLLAPNAPCHQLDECLQSTLVSIEPNGINLSIHLTPGIAIANQVLTRIDPNHDGIISTNEANAYIAQFEHDFAVTLNHQPVSLNLTAFDFPEMSELTNGFGMIQFDFSIPSPDLQPGQNQLTIENHHLPEFSAYLANAAQPKSAAIQIISQNRNQTQSTTTIVFTYRLPVSLSKRIISFALLGLLYCAMLTTVWRLQRKRV